MLLGNSIWAVSLAATLLLQPALAQDDGDTEQGARFTYPTESDLIFHEQDTVRVSWESEYSSSALWTFCREAGDDGENVLRTKNIIEQAQGMNGSERIVINFSTTANDCWFNLRDNNSDRGINSVGFSVSAERGDEEREWQLDSESQTTTSAPPSSATETTSTTDESSETEGESQNNGESGGGGGGLSTGAIAGIAVGVVVMVLGVIGALAFFLWRKRRQGLESKGAYKLPSNGEKYAGQLPSEMETDAPRPAPCEVGAAELPTRESARERVTRHELE
ncbi:hypothetical protein S7711_01378 [Stachybotrys chartarum IBT 7711]|uniref:Mid2 domain-containing protein n=1 Tax=Stachybotrys chartarum (strain CBS 109288 / IBT 7711) TaxID=1280523 RepID=A0A084B6S8_STACB|nr:hypothetical protein S7711_01378 [Stachybotrys chartarum IBT 7711]KFA46440.1 hypothetical protein S40293_04277 [Stachybotrys chartarum IBT 40293]